MKSVSPEDLEASQDLSTFREQGFFAKNPGIRLFLAIGFTFFLFLFFHLREERTEVLELGQQAERYLITQLGFTFPDEAETTRHRIEAVRDVGNIYRIREDEIEANSKKFVDFLETQPAWKEQFGEGSNVPPGMEKISGALAQLKISLIRARFTDRKTIQKMKSATMSVENVYALNLLEVDRLDLGRSLTLPADIWSVIVAGAFQNEPLSDAGKQLLTDAFSRVRWRFAEDSQIQADLYKRVQDAVPQKFTHVSEGTKIISPGEKVTARHVEMVHAMNKALNDKRSLWNLSALLGSAGLAIISVLVGAVYLMRFHPTIVGSNKKLALLLTICLLTLGLGKLIEFFILSTPSHVVELFRYPIVLPFAGILICSLLNARLATVASGFLGVILTITLVVERDSFLVINMMGAMVAIMSIRSFRKRKEVFIVCFKVWAICALTALAYGLYDGRTWDGDLPQDWGVLLLFSMGIAVLVVGILPILEALFQILTDITLVEYMDPNHPLLRRLSIEAPGTYQHSLVVGNLAETAALAIGANGLFCRVAALYHDIGKLVNPHYFSENQQTGVNVHQLLTPQESAQVIIAHVSEGVAMGRRDGLPERFIDIIKEHHGTTLVYFFYSRAKKQAEEEGSEEEVQQLDFRYAGPKPRSRESAIVMIADTLEAASRSLNDLSEKAVTELVERLVAGKAKDGQFDECLLTFEELGHVKKSMIKSLVAARHSRVSYPTTKSDDS